MPDKTESARIPRDTMKRYRQWAKESGRHISFLMNAALLQALTDKKDLESRMFGPKERRTA